MVEVTFIYEGRVNDQLDQLDKAVSKKNAKAIDAAKKLVRDSAKLTDFGMPTTRRMSQQGVGICRKYLRDVGDNTFIFDEDSLAAIIVACAI